VGQINFFYDDDAVVGSDRVTIAMAIIVVIITIIIVIHIVILLSPPLSTQWTLVFRYIKIQLGSEA